MRQIQGLIVDEEAQLRYALKIIDDNGSGLCFSVRGKVLTGVLTDGDVRRHLLAGGGLDIPVKCVTKKTFVALPISTDDRIVRKALSDRVRMIPLVNDSGEIIDIADFRRTHNIPVLEPDLSGNELMYVTECISSNWISSQGSYVTRFESLFSKMHNDRVAVAVSNGTTALHLALEALGVGPGDEVIVPDVTFAASINAILYCRAVPVICEIDEKSWCIDVDEAEKLISSKTKAIMPVHLYGQVCDFARLTALCRNYNLLMIEDCAEALGSTWNNAPVGVFGDAATFSFFGNKTISTGEGGMVLYRHEDVAARARVLRDHGMTPGNRYWHEVVGYNYRLTNIQSAIGVAQLERFDQILARKISIFERYNSALKDVKGISQLPFVRPNGTHSNWLYTVLLDRTINRDSVIRKLKELGVETRPVFYQLSSLPPYRKFSASKSLMASHLVSSQGLSLPTSSTLTLDELQYVVRSLAGVLGDFAV
jgi:perosamine synthetase